MQKKIRHVNRDQLSAEKPASSNSFIIQSTEVNEKFMIIIIFMLYWQKCVFCAGRTRESSEQSTNYLSL